MSKSAKKVTTLSAAKRSSIAKRAAHSAWAFMRSAAYVRAKKQGKSALNALRARHAA